MCIAIPLQVIRTEPGHAWVAGRGQRRRVNCALVGELAIGDWVLVFLDSARERIDAQRAAEVNTLLDLIEAATAPGAADPGFTLPSALNPEQLAVLAGGPTA